MRRMRPCTTARSFAMCSISPIPAKSLGGQRLPLGANRSWPEGEGVAEPYPSTRRTQSSAVRAPEVGEHDALMSLIEALDALTAIVSDPRNRPQPAFAIH